jgi:hypothetical protein
VLLGGELGEPEVEDVFRKHVLAGQGAILKSSVTGMWSLTLSH